MDFNAEILYRILNIFKIIECSENGKRYRFMKRSLFYIPLVSLLCLTAIRLFYIIYRLDELYDCNLNIKEILFDSRNNDILFLEFEIQNCSLPANCEFIHTSIRFVKNESVLVKIEMNPFFINKNEQIKVKCPIKVGEIDLIELINFSSDSSVTLEFDIKLKVRFLFVVVPITFKSSLKIDQFLSSDSEKISYTCHETKIVGNINEVKMETLMSLENIPKYLNMKQSRISVQSKDFIFHISPIIIENGFLKEKIKVELEVITRDTNTGDDIISFWLKHKRFGNVLNIKDVGIIENTINGLILIADNTNAESVKFFLCDSRKNKIALVYEINCNNNLTKTKQNYKFELFLKEKDYREETKNAVNVFTIGENGNKEGVSILYDLKTESLKPDEFFNNCLIEIMKVDTVEGHLVITIKIFIEELNFAIDVNLLPSITHLKLVLNGKVFNIPTVVTIITENIILSFIFNEYQIQELVECFMSENFKMLQVSTRDIEHKVLKHLKFEITQDITISLFFDQMKIFVKQFKAPKELLNRYLFIHEIVNDSRKGLFIVTKYKDKGFSETNDLLIYVSRKKIELILKSNGLNVKSTACLDYLTITADGGLNFNFKAQTMIHLENVSLISRKSLWEIGIVNSCSANKHDNIFSFELNFENLNTGKPKTCDLKNTGFTFLERLGSEQNKEFKFDLHPSISPNAYKMYGIINVFKLSAYNVLVLHDIESAFEFEIRGIEIVLNCFSGKFEFFIAKDVFVNFKVLGHTVYFNNLHVDLGQYTLLSLLKHYWNEYYKGSPCTDIDFIENEDPVKIDMSVQSKNNTTRLFCKVLFPVIMFENILYDFTLLDRRLELHKDDKCFKLKLNKNSQEETFGLINFLEFELTEIKGTQTFSSEPKIEIFDLKGNKTLILILKASFIKGSGIPNYGNLDILEMFIKKDNMFSKLSLNGYLYNSCVSNEVAKLLMFYYKLLFGNNPPNYSLVEFKTDWLDLINHKNEDSAILSLLDSSLLFEIYLTDFLEDEYIPKNDIQSLKNIETLDSYEKNNLELFCRYKNKKGIRSRITFKLVVLALMVDYKILLDLADLEINTVLNIFSSRKTSLPSLFKLRFLKDNLFMVLFRGNLTVSLPEYNTIYVDVHENKRIFLQLLLNPAQDNNLSKDFYILGFASLNKLTQDFSFIVKRFFFQPSFSMDVKKNELVILSSEVTCYESYLRRFALTLIGFIDLFVYSENLLEFYLDIRHFRFFNAFFNEMEYVNLYDYRKKADMDQIQQMFIRRIKEERIEFD